MSKGGEREGGGVHTLHAISLGQILPSSSRD